MELSLEPKGFLNSHARRQTATAEARSIVRVCNVNDERHFENFEHCTALDLIYASAFSIEP